MVCVEVERQKGASLIEFALVLPVFLALVLGILYFGIAFFTQQAVNFAAARGAEAAISITPEAVTSDGYALVKQQANARIRQALAYFPGVEGAFPADGSRAEARGVTVDEGCTLAPTASTTVLICVESGDSGDGSRRIQVSLAPRFDQLWPGFPDPGFFPTPEFVRASGSAMLAEAPDANEG